MALTLRTHVRYSLFSCRTSLSPTRTLVYQHFVTLFSIYAEEMMLEVFNGTYLGIKVGGRKVVDVQFADDQ